MTRIRGTLTCAAMFAAGGDQWNTPNWQYPSTPRVRRRTDPDGHVTLQLVEDVDGYTPEPPKGKDKRSRVTCRKRLRLKKPERERIEGMRRDAVTQQQSSATLRANILASYGYKPRTVEPVQPEPEVTPLAPVTKPEKPNDWDATVIQARADKAAADWERFKADAEREKKYLLARKRAREEALGLV